LFHEDVARVAHDLGLTLELLCFLGRCDALDLFLPTYKKAVSRAIHPDLQDSEAGKTCEVRLKRFNSGFETLISADQAVKDWFALSTATREGVLLSELHRRNRELQQLRKELANERQERTKRWDISAR
jgi:hypothetical protein